jgi:hypothetical protein
MFWSVIKFITEQVLDVLDLALLLRDLLLLRDDGKFTSLDIFLDGIRLYFLFHLVWNFRWVLRFLLRVGLYLSIPIGLAALLSLWGGVR